MLTRGELPWRKRFALERRRIADVNADLENSLSGIRVAKSFVNEDYEEERFDRANTALKGPLPGLKAMATYSAA